jgi:hypothetical protein
MAAKAKSSKSAPAKSRAVKPSKAAKAKTSKPAAAPKKIKAPAKAKIKPVKAPARAQDQPAPADAQATGALVEVYYVLLDPLPPQIHTARPLAASEAVEFASFAEAKERAIDHLIELIEEAERRLHVLRRATSREELPR